MEEAFLVRPIPPPPPPPPLKHTLCSQHPFYVQLEGACLGGRVRRKRRSLCKIAIPFLFSIMLRTHWSLILHHSGICRHSFCPMKNRDRQANINAFLHGPIALASCPMVNYDMKPTQPASTHNMQLLAMCYLK